MNTQATKISAGHWELMGWQIEKMEQGHWNMRPPGEEFFTDSADTLKECKLMIVRWESGK